MPQSIKLTKSNGFFSAQEAHLQVATRLVKLKNNNLSLLILDIHEPQHKIIFWKS